MAISTQIVIQSHFSWPLIRRGNPILIKYDTSWLADCNFKCSSKLPAPTSISIDAEISAKMHSFLLTCLTFVGD